MREIKFRLWENGQMYYQVQAGGFPNTLPTVYLEKDGVFWWVNSTGENPVMQYTGLKDKNGKEIFEGDIIQECNIGDKIWEEFEKTAIVEQTPIGEVIWENEGALFNVKKLREGIVRFADGSGKSNLFLDHYDGLYMWRIDGGIEIIGNIYENPELLKN